MFSEAQESAVRQIICDKRPEQRKQLIERECGIKLSVCGVGNYLKRWGFTPQKPIKKAYEQRPEAVQDWLDKEYPAIEARDKLEGFTGATKRGGQHGRAVAATHRLARHR